MKFVTSEQMRELDRKTIHEYKISGEVLMMRAGRGIARQVLQIIHASGKTQPRVWLAAGKGNNGGDAFVVARLLHQAGIQTELWLAEIDVKGEARPHFDLMKAEGVSWRVKRIGRPMRSTCRLQISLLTVCWAPGLRAHRMG
jgi:ADP-dependent NAD(P)H-hydrate dehydratase / NAD(P)H-hydrate epimerase